MKHPLDGLTRGETYEWTELQDAEYFGTGFGTGGGIKTKTDADGQEYIILFSSEDGIYNNNVGGETFNYIGQGRPEQGDQDEDRYTNAALISAIDDGRPVYFFYRENRRFDWTYRGLVNVHKYETRYRESEDRNVLVFTMSFETTSPQPTERLTDTQTQATTDDETALAATTDPPETATTTREHVEIQYYLITLGQQQGYDVYVAKNDRNETYDGTTFTDVCLDTLPLSGFSEEACDIIEYVDVIWLDGTHIVKMFEIESTTSIYSGILRMTDFVTEVPNLAVDMYVVAPSDDKNLVRKHMRRPTFQHILNWSSHCSLDYLPFDTVRDKHDLVMTHGPLADVF